MPARPRSTLPPGAGRAAGDGGDAGTGAAIAARRQIRPSGGARAAPSGWTSASKPYPTSPLEVVERPEAPPRNTPYAKARWAATWFSSRMPLPPRTSRASATTRRALAASPQLHQANATAGSQARGRLSADHSSEPISVGARRGGRPPRVDGHLPTGVQPHRQAPSARLGGVPVVDRTRRPEHEQSHQQRPRRRLKDHKHHRPPGYAWVHRRREPPPRP
jgi:hypothetical protein